MLPVSPLTLKGISGVSRGSSVRSDECPQVLSFESFTVGAVDYSLKMKKMRCVVEQKCCSLLVSAAGCRYQALLASTSAPHLNV